MNFKNWKLIRSVYVVTIISMSFTLTHWVQRKDESFHRNVLSRKSVPSTKVKCFFLSHLSFPQNRATFWPPYLNHDSLYGIFSHRFFSVPAILVERSVWSSLFHWDHPVPSIILFVERTMSSEPETYVHPSHHVESTVSGIQYPPDFLPVLLLLSLWSLFIAKEICLHSQPGGAREFIFISGKTVTGWCGLRCCQAEDVVL